jgi:hypothetical protein
MAFWLNRCTLSLRRANTNSILDDEENRKQKEGFKTLGLQASVTSKFPRYARGGCQGFDLIRALGTVNVKGGMALRSGLRNEK